MAKQLSPERVVELENQILEPRPAAEHGALARASPGAPGHAPAQPIETARKGETAMTTTVAMYQGSYDHIRERLDALGDGVGEDVEEELRKAIEGLNLE